MFGRPEASLSHCMALSSFGRWGPLEFKAEYANFIAARGCGKTEKSCHSGEGTREKNAFCKEPHEPKDGLGGLLTYWINLASHLGL